MLTDIEIKEKYGEPGDESNLVNLRLPFPMRIAWDLQKTINSFKCHKKVAGQLESIFGELLQHYGYDKIKELGIDLYGGCYNFRQMRGSKTKWSRHAWAIAIDLDPARNGLKVKKPKAQFSKPEYKPMIDIFYKHGFISYGLERDFDWMHFEASS